MLLNAIYFGTMKQLCRKFIALAILILALLPVYSQNMIKTKVPKLVVFVNIDELQTEHLLKFKNKFTKHGFNQIIERGTFFHNSDYETSTTYKGTKLTNFYTGTYPGMHGIISDKWYTLNQPNISKAYSFNAADAVNHPDSGYFSTSEILSSTIADELLIMNRGKSKVASVGITPEDIAFLSHSDQTSQYWFDRTTGKMVCSSKDSLQQWVQKFNSMKFADMYINRQWGPAFDLRNYNEFVTGGDKEMRHFMYDLKAPDHSLMPYSKLPGTPFENYLIRDFAASLVINENLGKDEFTDILSVNFTCKPFIEDEIELFDAEVEDMLLRLDEQIESFIQVIKDNVGLEQTLFIFTSTPTINWGLKTLQNNNISTGYFNGQKTSALLNLYLMAIYGQGKWVKGYENKQFYLNHELIKEKDISFEEIQDKAARFLLEVSGVQNTITGINLRTNNYTNGVYGLMQKSYYFGRSGDLFVSLKPGWIEEIKENQKHSFKSNRCTIPMIFFGWNINPAQIVDKVKMIDVAPTISTILEIPKPNGAIGKPINEIIKQIDLKN